MKNKLFRGLMIAIVVFSITFILYVGDVFDVWEWKTWDLRLRLFSESSRASENIVIFLIDQNSLDVYEQAMEISWPWPREMYSYILEYCMRAGAKAVFIDFVFSESSSWGVDDDQLFAETMAISNDVFLPISLSKSTKEIDESSSPVLKTFSLTGFPSLGESAIPMESVSLPVPNLLSSAKGVGNTTFAQDKDSVYRRMPLVFSLNDLLLPSVPLALSLFLDETLSPADIPLDLSNQMIIKYYGPTGTYASYSAAAIINSYAKLQEGKPPQIPPETFKGKVVFIGGSAPGILDLRPTPFSPVCPGVEILATTLDNLLQKDFIRIPPPLVLFLFIGILSLITAIGSSILKKIWMTIPFAVFCLGLLASVTSLAFGWGYWLEFVAPGFAVLLSFTGAMVLNYSFEGRQKRYIKSAFRHYLSPDVIDRVLADSSLLRLGGEKRIITSYFSDVAGFTSISESLSPEELVHLLNDYLSEMTDIILSYGGTLDKYEGDAIIAFWNAPLDQPDHAVRACRAALDCQKRLEELRPEFAQKSGHELFMRIGLNSGPAVVGNMGSHSRFDYTAMGDTINMASRLEGACKHYTVPILVGDTTFQMAQDDIAAREVDLIRVVGKSKPERVYQILEEKSQISLKMKENVTTFHKALDFYRKRGWDDALNLFKKIKDDKLSAMYVARIEQLKQSPPPDDWAGVYDLTQK
ncbi:MAG: adenylate/guanylate cyclase domain-containing protein [Candidatus Aminicenantes bacterium]|nr:MAG: adenylate/guanylate cyclase domain-containing protein [Candidatus Aminicenantes bacterium]